MIRITVDLIPGGDMRHRTTIGVLDVWNTAEHLPLPEQSTYDYLAATDQGTFSGGNITHARSDGIWILLQKILGNLAPKAPRRIR